MDTRGTHEELLAVYGCSARMSHFSLGPCSSPATAVNIKLAVTVLIRFFKRTSALARELLGRGVCLGVRWESGGVDMIKIYCTLHCTHLSKFFFLKEPLIQNTIIATPFGSLPNVRCFLLLSKPCLLTLQIIFCITYL